MRTIAAALLAAALAVPAFASDADKFTMMPAADVAAALKTDKKPIVCDANGKSTREKHGIVPGAVLLTHASKFDAAKELPADKDAALVFYCGGPKCMASHEAANRAAKAGYKDVRVMPEGITGWKEAGHPVAALPKAEKKSKGKKS
jgi:rhodanese-related sulfurtransferase